MIKKIIKILAGIFLSLILLIILGFVINDLTAKTV